MSLHRSHHSDNHHDDDGHHQHLREEELEVNNHSSEQVEAATLRFADDQLEVEEEEEVKHSNMKFFHSERWRKLKVIVWYLIKLLSGPLVALPFLCNVLTPLGATVQINRCAAITVWIVS